ncbi:MAG TPA: hypothetical protein VI197_20595 [Polyangiaceae bacterium]
MTALATPASAQDAAESNVYLDIFGAGLFGLESTHEWNHDCPHVMDPMTGEQLDISCDARVPMGGALGLRLGLILQGAVGFEAFAIGAGDWSKVGIDGFDVPGVPASLESMQIGRVGGAFGGGLRLSTPTTGLRLSAGLGPGVALRRVYTNVSSLDGSSTNYAAPMLLGDVSLTFGKSFTIGILAWAEFSKTISIEPDLSRLPGAEEAAAAFTQIERVTVFQGIQWFIGPMIAFHHRS